MDDAELLKALAKHMETCFHKHVCDICCVNGCGEIAQCDYCGDVYNMTHNADIYTYKCKCGEGPYLTICLCCSDVEEHYEIIEEPKDIHECGVYVNDCCPITKAAK